MNVTNAIGPEWCNAFCDVKFWVSRILLENSVCSFFILKSQKIYIQKKNYSQLNKIMYKYMRKIPYMVFFNVTL